MQTLAGEVSWRTAEARAIGKQIPEHFAAYRILSYSADHRFSNAFDGAFIRSMRSGPV